MTRDTEFLEALESYLEEHEGSTPLPDSLRKAVRAALPRTRQVSRRRPRRTYPGMSLLVPTAAGVGAAAALLVAAVIIGGSLLSSPRQRVGGPEDSGTPAPTPTPAAFMGQSPGELAAATYWIDWAAYRVRLPHRMLVSVPPDWDRFDGELPAIVRNGGEPPSGAAVSYWTVDNLVADPCHPEGGLLEPRLAGSVEDLAESLTQVPGYQVTEPQPVSVDGFEGLYLEMRSPTDTSECTDGVLKLWETAGRQFGQGPEQENLVWIVDVDGVRLVIVASHFAGTADETVAELRQIVSSVEFVSE